MKRKVFVYVTAKEAGANYLLAFKSHHEPGYEVPKGSVEPGEDLPTAVRREVQEESGITDLENIEKLGIVHWQEQEQHFYQVRARSARLDAYDYFVTGNDFDRGFRYQFKWLELNSSLEKLLFQGCDRFLAELISAVSKD